MVKSRAALMATSDCPALALAAEDADADADVDRVERAMARFEKKGRAKICRALDVSTLVRTILFDGSIRMDE